MSVVAANKAQLVPGGSGSARPRTSAIPDRDSPYSADNGRQRRSVRGSGRCQAQTLSLLSPADRFLNLILSHPQISLPHSRGRFPLCCERIATLGRCSCIRQQPSILFSRESPVNIPTLPLAARRVKGRATVAAETRPRSFTKKPHLTSRLTQRDELFT